MWIKDEKTRMINFGVYLRLAAEATTLNITNQA